VADWSTIASVGTAAGTLVLGAATFASVRSANRAARVAERSLLIGLRPVLVPSREGDPLQTSRWGDGYSVRIAPGRGHVAVTDEVIYLAIALRNTGAGLAVLSGWQAHPRMLRGMDAAPNADDFRRLRRDLYVPAGDVGYWQSAIRGREDPQRDAIAGMISAGDSITVELLYSDHEGGQPTISRFVLYREPDDPPEEPWRADVIRHWSVAGVDPHI
jgi:hypothetical protein